MIYLYSGTPGSGKSFHAVKQIMHFLKRGNVIANFGMSVTSTRFHFWDNSEITVDRLIDFSRKNHQRGKEGQTLLVLDEAQLLFNSRNWNSAADTRLEWIKFFSQHRKLGYSIILVAQFDRMIDRQIRCLIEYELAHMKVNNFWRIIPMTVFLVVHRWYGQRMKINHEMLLYNKKIARAYDTFSMFDNGTEPGTDMGPGVPSPEPGTAPMYNKRQGVYNLVRGALHEYIKLGKGSINHYYHVLVGDVLQYEIKAVDR